MFLLESLNAYLLNFFLSNFKERSYILNVGTLNYNFFPRKYKTGREVWKSNDNFHNDSWQKNVINFFCYFCTIFQIDDVSRFESPFKIINFIFFVLFFKHKKVVKDFKNAFYGIFV